MKFKLGSLVSAFVGVNEGYKGNNVDIKQPEQAVEIVKQEAVKRGIHAQVYQGYAIYPTSWGCPIGGEAIAAVFTQSDGETHIHDFDSLKQSLQQTSLAVVSSDQRDGQSTEGFDICLGDVGLSDYALKWQDLAQKQKDAGGSYICGVLYLKDGKVYAQAEANPNKKSSNYVQDISQWKSDVKKLFSQMTQTQQPRFRKVGFTYLRS